MFEGLRQDIGYLAGEAGRASSDLMGRVRAAMPHVSIPEFHPIDRAVEIARSTTTTIRDASRYVYDNSRAFFYRITEHPIAQRAAAAARRAEQRIEHAVREFVDQVTQLTNDETPHSQGTQPAATQPSPQTQRELRVCLEQRPTQTAQALGSARVALQTQPTSSARVARFDAAVVATCRQIVTSSASPTAARSLVAHVASLLPEPLRLQIVDCLRETPQPTLRVASTEPREVPETAHTAVITRPEGMCSGVWRVVHVDPRDDRYYAASLNPRPHVFDLPDVTPHYTPADILGTLPVGFTTPAVRPREVPFAFMGPDGHLIIQPPTHTPTVVATTTPSTTLFSETNTVVGTDPSVTFISGADRTSVPYTAVTFVAANDNALSTQPTRERPEPTSRVVNETTIRPRNSHPVHSDGTIFSGLFAEAPANDGPHFVSPAQAGYVVPEHVAFTRAQGAPLPAALGGANPRVAMRGEPHDGQGQGGGYPGGGNNGEGEGRNGQGNPQDRRRQPEEAPAEAAA